MSLATSNDRYATLVGAWRIDYGSTWSLGWGILAVCVLIVIAAGYYRTERITKQQAWLLATLRGLAMLLGLWMLWGWSIVQEAVDLPELWIAVDESQSMTLPLDHRASSSSQVTRWSGAWERIRESALQAELAKRYQVRYVLIGGGAHTISDEKSLTATTPTLLRSQLGDDLASLLGRVTKPTVCGVWLFSDGRINEGGSFVAALTANVQNLPVFVTPLGNDTERMDLALQDLRTTSPAIPGDFVEVSGSLVNTGTKANSVTARLVDETGSILDQQVLEIHEGSSRQPVSLGSVVRQPGGLVWQVIVEPITGEVDTANNHANVQVRVREQPFNVLLIASAASYEFRFLKHLLERSMGDAEQPMMQLTSVLQDADPRYADQDRSAASIPPTDDASLAAVDVFVLLDADLEGLGESLLKRLAHRVDDGGAGLLMVAGPKHLPASLSGTALAAFNPVELSTARSDPFGSWQLRRTPFGASERTLRLPTASWEQVPAVNFLPKVVGQRIAAQVLLEGIAVTGGLPRPVLVMSRQGAGTVAIQLTDEMFRLTTLAGADRSHEWYWLQLLRRLARGRHAAAADFAEIRVEPSKILPHETAKIVATLSTELAASAAGDVRVSITANDEGAAKRVLRLQEDQQTPEFWTAEIKGLTPGSWQLAFEHPSLGVNAVSANLVVTETATEMSEIRGDRAALIEVAALSSGAVLDLDQSTAQWLSRLPESEPISVRPYPPLPLWNHVAMISLLVGLLITEWALRRWWGLL